MNLDALFVSPHPDDAEFALGGTLLVLADKGLRTGIIDLSAGENGSFGSREIRASEAARASELLGLAHREVLGLEDGEVRDTREARAALAERIRGLRPRLLVGPVGADPHPDHAAAEGLVRGAVFVAGLARRELGGEAPWRVPRRLGVPLSGRGEASCVVPIDAVWERKLVLLRCYASQLAPRADGKDPLRTAETRARWWGEQVGARYGEALVADEPLACADPASLVP